MVFLSRERCGCALFNARNAVTAIDLVPYSNLNGSTELELDSGMPTPPPPPIRLSVLTATSFHWRHRRRRAAYVRSVVSSRSSSRSRSRKETTALSSPATQFTSAISSEQHSVEDPLGVTQARTNSIGPGAITATSSAESITGTNEFQTSPTFTPTQVRAFTTFFRFARLQVETDFGESGGQTEVLIDAVGAA
jgi:hypothetical protein